jgi:DNA-directed RNA polymerase specialized sigma24 family protein
MLTPGDITALLRAWRSGDDSARDALFELVYGNLHALARRFLRAERHPHALQATEQLGVQRSQLEVTELDDALNRLAELEPALARVVELKDFGGLTNEEVGAVEGVSEATVKRSWRAVRAWLDNDLTGAS